MGFSFGQSKNMKEIFLTFLTCLIAVLFIILAFYLISIFTDSHIIHSEPGSCWYCSGDGWYNEPSGNAIECDICNGDGWIGCGQK